MLKKISIKKLYPLALAEGEGVGTAYEYYAKRLLLSRWLADREPPHNILIAGLPQKYGASMDFLLLGAELNAELTIVDERPQAITRCKTAFEELQKSNGMAYLAPHYLLTEDIVKLPGLSDDFDLALSSEVLQRLPEENQLNYMTRILQLASKAALFTPNGDNPSHTSLSGLSGLQLGELELLSKQVLQSIGVNPARDSLWTGYVDMPPFPPGMTRTEDQREHATSGTGEAIAMWGLANYARIEQWLPHGWRRNKSHIVYSFLDNSQR